MIVLLVVLSQAAVQSQQDYLVEMWEWRFRKRVDKTERNSGNRKQ